LGVAVGDELAKAVGAAVGDGPQQVVVAGDAGDGVMVLRGLGFREANPPVFGVGETAAGDDVVGGLRGRSKHGVPCGDAPFVPRYLDQHQMAVDVADGEDVADVRPQVSIDGDRGRFCVDPGRL
jgi:hypothetical protein